jgi:hypothetical protein
MSLASFALLPLLAGPVVPAAARPFPKPRPVYGEEAVALPMVDVPGDPLRLYVRVNDPVLGDRVFFLDTAFSRTTCDDHLAQDLGLETERTLRRSYGELGSVRLERLDLPPFELGGHTIPDLHCAVRDLDTTSSVASSEERPIAGVLGANLLGRFVVVIDPRERTVTLLDPERHGLEEGPGVVRLRLERGIGPRVRFPLWVDGREAWPLLDTGATRSHLDAERLGLPLIAEREGTARASGSTNQELTTFRIHAAENIELAGHSVGSLRIIDRPKGPCTPGLAGQDVLGMYRLTIDTRHRLLKVEQR